MWRVCDKMQYFVLFNITMISLAIMSDIFWQLSQKTKTLCDVALCKHSTLMSNANTRVYWNKGYRPYHPCLTFYKASLSWSFYASVIFQWMNYGPLMFYILHTAFNHSKCYSHSNKICTIAGTSIPEVNPCIILR